MLEDNDLFYFVFFSEVEIGKSLFYVSECFKNIIFLV